MIQVWPMVAKLIESNTDADPDRRGDAIERAVDDLVKLLGEARRTIHACNARIEREEAPKRNAPPGRASHWWDD